MDTFRLIKYDREGLWSLSYPEEAEKISKIILELVNNKLIMDCTSGLGGNTFSFSKYFKKVISIELDKNRYNMLKKNINHNNIKNVKMYNDDCVKFLRKKTDAYFFDPPWGGPDYKLKESISIKLSNKSLYEIVKIIRKYNNGLIFFKLPFNYNMSEFNEFNYNVNKIRNYLLVSIF
jgi:16S rRNA G966 N2-methylase RsmD